MITPITPKLFSPYILYHSPTLAPPALNWESSILQRLPPHLVKPVTEFFLSNIVSERVDEQSELVSWLLKATPGIDLPADKDPISELKKIVAKITVLDLSDKNLNNECIKRLSQVVDINTILTISGLTSNIFTKWSALESVVEQNDNLILIPGASAIREQCIHNIEEELTGIRWRPDYLKRAPKSQAVKNPSHEINLTSVSSLKIKHKLPAKAPSSTQLSQSYGVTSPNNDSVQANRLFPMKKWSAGFSQMIPGTTLRKNVNNFVRYKEFPKDSEEQSQVVHYFLCHKPEGKYFPSNTDLAAYLKVLLARIVRLDLSWRPRMRVLNDDQIVLLSSAFAQDTSLKTLILCGQPFGEKGITALREQITNNGLSIQLNLQGTKVTNKTLLPAEPQHNNSQPFASENNSPATQKRKGDQSLKVEESSIKKARVDNSDSGYDSSSSPNWEVENAGEHIEACNLKDKFG